MDAGPDASEDAGADAGSDAGADAGSDAAVDAGSDAGSDAGADAGANAGSLCTQPCAAVDQCHTAGVCDPATGLCSSPARSDGAACDDGNACTQLDSCRSGVCTPGLPVACRASDACHAAGSCDPRTGHCSDPAQPDGTTCDDLNACTLTDHCLGGLCVGANAVVCRAADQCHAAGACDPGNGACSNPAAPDGSACSDGNACTRSDQCQAGACVGGAPLACPATDQCHAAGTCAPGTGACSNPIASDGTACSDGNPSTAGDVCTGGVCAGVDHCVGVTCPAADQCHSAGTCDHATGQCSIAAVADGTACSDGNPCTQSDTCRAGVCSSGAPVVCGALDACHVAGVCASSTGLCSHPVAADGTTCNDSNACTTVDACLAGVCTGSSPVACPAPDACHTAGSCDPGTGACSYSAQPNGTPCDDGNACTSADVCAAGTCAGTPILGCVPLPSDPVAVAPAVDQTVATDLAAGTAFLYTGPNPIQTGVASGTIDRLRVAVLRGRVRQGDGSPLPGVEVTALGHPELGATLTRADGVFDFAVNGGGALILVLQKDGYISAQRQVAAPWRDFAWADDAVLLRYDTQVTVVTLGAGAAQVAQGSPVTDADGTRQATVIIPSGTQAGMLLADGTLQPLSAMHIRATEFTVGTSGPMAMPGQLPTDSAYTYAVELSVDEAVAAGATTVQFDRAVPFYLENFLGFRVGSPVPVGYYDHSRGVWVASDSGKVVKVLSVTAGLADLDVSGGGTPATSSTLAALGITDEERAQVALLHAPGATLWRVGLTHFTPVDCNPGFGPPPGAGGPNPGPPKPPKKPGTPKPCSGKGSIIDCQNQILSEAIPLAGAPLELRYSSDRLLGAKLANRLIVPVSGATVPPPLKRIEVSIQVAGRQYSASFPPQPGQSYTLVWDGLDAYHRLLVGAQPVQIRISYVYDAVYTTTDRFGGRGAPFSSVPARREIYMDLDETAIIGGPIPQAFPAWDLGVHHSYDPGFRELRLGTGERVSATDLGTGLVQVFAGGPAARSSGGGLGLNCQTQADCGPGGICATIEGYLYKLCYKPPEGDGGPATQAFVAPTGGIKVAADGSVFFAERNFNRVRKIDPAGVITTFAGLGISGGGLPNGDGGPANRALLYYPRGLALGADGSVYIVDDSVVRRVGPDGIISTFAGGNYSIADGAPATQYDLQGYAWDVAAGPDGSVFISVADQYLNGAYVIKIDPAGRAYGLAGRGSGGDYALAKAALVRPLGLDIDGRGTLYLAESANSANFGNKVRRIDTAGFLLPFAGTGAGGNSGDGASAPLAKLYATGVATGPGGSVYIADGVNGRVRLVDASGAISTFAGSDAQGALDALTAPGGFATRTRLTSLSGLAVGPDGSVFLAVDKAVLRVTPALPGVANGDQLVPSPDGSELFLFDVSGRHQRTFDALTLSLRWQFAYDSAGRLARVTDGSGNATTVGYDASGHVASITGPYGQVSSLTTDADGLLTAVSNPAGQAWSMTYAAGGDGLLSTLTDPLGGVHRFTYDADGRLTKDEDPAGGSTTLARTETATGHSVALTSALGQTHTFLVETMASGTVRRVHTEPSGAVTEVLLSRDGLQSATYPDGSRATVMLGPDPRWGMAAPVSVSSTFTPPGGPTLSRSVVRSATLAVPGYPLSLQSLTETVTLNGGPTSTLTWDAASRALTRTSGAGRVTRSLFDAQGQLLSHALPGSATSTAAWDDRGRVIRTTRGDQSWTIAYDAQGRVASRTDAAGAATTYAYDAAGRPVQTTLPGGGVYRFGWDALGRRTSVTLPSGAVHGESLSSVDQLVGYTPPGGPAYSFGRDADHRMTGATLPGGRSEVASYDPQGRTASFAYPEASLDVSYPAGDLTGRPASYQRAPTGGATQGLSFAWVAGSLASSTTFSGPASGSYSYAYDSGLQLAGIHLSRGAASEPLAIDRDPDGLPTQLGPFALVRSGPLGAPVSIGDGSFDLTLAYDGTGRVARRTTRVGASALFDQQLEYGAGGRLSRSTESVGGAAHLFDFGYDLDGRLAQVTRDGTTVESYSYDGNGNRTSRQFGAGAVQVATYDLQDRLTGLGAVDTVVGPDGFLVSRGADTFTYSTHGELLTAVVAGQGVTYDYDALGRRVARTDAGGTTQYLYGNPEHHIQLTASVSPAGVLTTYLYEDGGRLLALRRNGALTYVAVDQLGSPRVMSDASGVVLETLEWDRYGNLTADSAPGFDLPIGFAGGLRDPVTGLLRFGLRDYDPAAGRWTTRDPLLFDSRSANLYAYVGDDPVNHLDPLGYATISVSEYDGLGGGVKLGIGPDENGRFSVSFCVEAGVGLGSSVDIDPLGKVDETGMFTELQGKVAGGPVSLEATLDLKECDGMLKPSGKVKVCAGPSCVDSDNGPGYSLNKPEADSTWRKANGLLKTPVIEGKLAAVFCGKY